MERRDIMNGRKLVGKNEIQTYEREKKKSLDWESRPNDRSYWMCERDAREEELIFRQFRVGEIHPSCQKPAAAGQSPWTNVCVRGNFHGNHH